MPPPPTPYWFVKKASLVAFFSPRAFPDALILRRSCVSADSLYVSQSAPNSNDGGDFFFVFSQMLVDFCLLVTCADLVEFLSTAKGGFLTCLDAVGVT